MVHRREQLQSVTGTPVNAGMTISMLRDMNVKRTCLLSGDDLPVVKKAIIQKLQR